MAPRVTQNGGRAADRSANETRPELEQTLFATSTPSMRRL